jgi:hypothetical protein
MLAPTLYLAAAMPGKLVKCERALFNLALDSCRSSPQCILARAHNVGLEGSSPSLSIRVLEIGPQIADSP